MQDNKQKLSEAWTDDLEKAIAGYHLFSKQAVSMDSKEFVLYHNACKAALGHVLMLKKIIEADQDKTDEPDFWTVLNEARKATTNDEQQDNDFD